METEEALLPALGGLAAGAFLGTFVLAPAGLDTPLWGTGDKDRDALISLRDRLEQAGIPVKATGLRGSQMSGVGLGQKGQTFNLLLVKKADFDKAFAIANQMMTPEVTG